MPKNSLNADELADRLNAALPPGRSDLPSTDDGDALIRAASLLAAQPRPEISPDDLARIQTRVLEAYRQQFPNHRPQPARKTYRPVWRWMAAAAAMTIIGAAALLWRSAQFSTQAETLTPVSIAALATTTDAYTPEPSATPSPTALPSTPTDQPAVLPSATDAPLSMPTATAPPTDTETPPSPTPFIAYVSASQPVNVRAEPSRQSDIITTVHPGAAVMVIGISADGDWKQIRLDAGRIGWVAGALLSPNKPPVATSTPAGTTIPERPGLPDAETGVESGSEDQNSQGGDFGCEHPGNFCNAPGQDGKQPPGQGKKDIPNNKGNSGKP
jgi:uncharacterized protein YgiM (DUF1202 family)